MNTIIPAAPQNYCSCAPAPEEKKLRLDPLEGRRRPGMGHPLTPVLGKYFQ